MRETPSSEEAARFAEELRCETLRPELLALTGELAKPSPPTPRVSQARPRERNAVNDATSLTSGADAERRIAALESDKEALATEVSRLQRNQAPPSPSNPAVAAPAPPPKSEPQPASQATADAERRIAALESEKEALAAEVSKLQHDVKRPPPNRPPPRRRRSR